MIVLLLRLLLSVLHDDDPRPDVVLKVQGFLRRFSKDRDHVESDVNLDRNSSHFAESVQHKQIVNG